MSEATGGAVQKTCPNRKKKPKKPRLPASKVIPSTLQQDAKDDNSQEMKSKSKAEVKRRRKKKQQSSLESNISSQQLPRVEDSIEEANVIKETQAPITGLQLMTKDQREVLKKNNITLLEKRSPKNPKAVFLCMVCNYHCDTFKVVVKHVNDKRHTSALMVEEETTTLRLIPSPAVGQIQYLSLLLEDLASQNGLSEDNIKSRSNIVDMLNRYIGEKLKGFSVRMYGSSASGFGLTTSDLNLELIVPSEGSGPKGLTEAYNIIQDSPSFRDVQADFTADIPTVKFKDNGTNVQCPLTLNNLHAYKISELLANYVTIDSRVKILGVCLRVWAQMCHLDDAGAGMLPPYAFAILVVFFLQQINKPVLPVLHELSNSVDKEKPDNYLDAREIGTKWKCKNHMSTGELWLKLLKFYALEFDTKSTVVCIQQRAPLKKNSNIKRWHGLKIAIKDPFLPKCNVSRSMVNPISFEYLSVCLRNTYKYFGIIQTHSGPIFKQIVKETEENGLNSMEDFPETRNIVLNHPFFKSVKLNISEQGHKFDKLCDLIVTDKQASDMYSKFNRIYFNYSFTQKHFTGNQVFHAVCTACQKEGHTKQECVEGDLPEFQPTLPPINSDFIEILNQFCYQIQNKWAPAPEDLTLREMLVKQIEEHILLHYPEARLRLFGSTCNGFGMKNSDVDICLTFQNSKSGLEYNFINLIEDLLEKLRDCRILKNLVPITTAKVPILKFCHMESRLEGDISIYNTLGQENTKLLQTYAAIDNRVKILGYVVKRFAKVCDICDASRGSLSSYAYILMLIYFLQQCSPPVLPILQELSTVQPPPEEIVEDCNVYFYSDLNNLPSIWADYGKNTLSAGELWVQFLRFYASEFDFKRWVIAIRRAEKMMRFEKLWTSKCMAIEDPFDLTHNLGAGLSRKMHVYIIQSFRKGYLHFGTANHDCFSHADQLENYFLNPQILTAGELPNDRGCRICQKIGHFSKECPQNKKNRKNRKGHEDITEEAYKSDQCATSGNSKNMKCNSSTAESNSSSSMLEETKLSPKKEFRGEQVLNRGTYVVPILQTPVFRMPQPFLHNRPQFKRYGMPVTAPPFSSNQGHFVHGADSWRTREDLPLMLSNDFSSSDEVRSRMPARDTFRDLNWQHNNTAHQASKCNYEMGETFSFFRRSRSNHGPGVNAGSTTKKMHSFSQRRH